MLLCLVWWFWICRHGLCSRVYELQIHQTQQMIVCLIHDWWALPFSNRWAICIDILIVIQDYLYKASSRIPWNRSGFLNFCTVDILSQIIFRWGGWVRLSCVSCLAASLAFPKLWQPKPLLTVPWERGSKIISSRRPLK